MLHYNVAPYAGAWIEMIISILSNQTKHVAPYAGAWIEINECQALLPPTSRRSLRGSVD
ncbi:conserved hypothetical protein [Candidatus Desulfosporosinus infrequens]|uniref:Uncharacterized protein n=1 Tax=Candidatus Desulfosporosinus infrequens TaxID=2043169 RepID=A0A2U3LB02_9FIRM|nr:conserved hypothetical protein [Candidatus Desulfosporosinus infrequens]